MGKHPLTKKKRKVCALKLLLPKESWMNLNSSILKKLCNGCLIKNSNPNRYLQKILYATYTSVCMVIYGIGQVSSEKQIKTLVWTNIKSQLNLKFFVMTPCFG